MSYLMDNAPYYLALGAAVYVLAEVVNHRRKKSPNCLCGKPKADGKSDCSDCLRNERTVY